MGMRAVLRSLNAWHVETGEALPNKSQGDLAERGHQRQEHLGMTPPKP